MADGKWLHRDRSLRCKGCFLVVFSYLLSGSRRVNQTSSGERLVLSESRWAFCKLGLYLVDHWMMKATCNHTLADEEEVCFFFCFFSAAAVQLRTNTCGHIALKWRPLFMNVQLFSLVLFLWIDLRCVWVISNDIQLEVVAVVTQNVQTLSLCPPPLSTFSPSVPFTLGWMDGAIEFFFLSFFFPERCVWSL